jgi:purine-cytosine permease-like protein
MDLTAILPRYLNARRGGVLLACIGIVVCPWNFVNSASTFTVVLNSFGIFVAPLTGIVIADYWVVRKTNWKVGDLYVGNNTGIYWYTGGFNPRAFAAWVGVIWFSLRKWKYQSFWTRKGEVLLTWWVSAGFAAAISGTSYGVSWTRMMQISFFIGTFSYFQRDPALLMMCLSIPTLVAGIVGGFTLYSVFCKIWPVKGAREFEDIDWAMHGVVVINGSEVEGDEEKRSVDSGSAGKMAPQEVVSSDVSKV